MLKRIGIAALAAMAAASLGAAVVGEVKFDQQGGARLSREQLSSNVRLRTGAEFDREILDRDIKQLYKTGNFADVTGESVAGADGKITVLFRVRLKPRITKIDFEGNAKFKTGELGRLLTISEGGIRNDAKVIESINALRKFYLERGYRDARIDPVFLPDGKDGVRITFKINENLKLKVNDVAFDGAKLFSQWDLRHSIANQYSYMNLLPFLNDYLNFGLLDRGELHLDRGRLREKYQDAGYLDFKVDKIDIVPDRKDPEFVDVRFTLSEGEPYRVGKITISGNSVFPAADLEKLLMLKTGETFSRSAEQASAQAIIRRYEALGYADVTCRALRTADFKTHTADVNFEVVEGRKFTVRNIEIVNNIGTKDKVIRRELAIQPGDPVDRNRIEISRRRLLGMGYFSKVEAESVNADALNEKDVKIRVEEKEARWNFRIGAGASDVNSVFGMAEVSTDNFDLFNPYGGFYGGGQRLRLQGIYGVENAGFNLDFVEPWFMDLPIRFELSGFLNTAEFENWDETRAGGRFSFQKKIFDNFTSLAIGYKFEAVRVDNLSHKLKSYIKANDLDGTFLVSQPSIMLGRDTRDSMTDPTEGYNINLFASVTPQVFGSSSSYHRLEAKGSYHTNFFDKFLVFSFGGKIGTVSDFGNGEDIPLFERYFMGGSNSLRGFEYRTVGPTVNDENIGGQTMLLLTAEMSHAIWGPLRGAAFVDIGNSWQDSYHMNIKNINIGAGYGLRIKLPWVNVPIRLDLAYPVLNNQEGERSKFRIHFNVGFTL